MLKNNLFQAGDSKFASTVSTTMIFFHAPIKSKRLGTIKIIIWQFLQQK